MPKIARESLESFVVSIFVAGGVPDDSAHQVAQQLVDADCAGHPSHGVLRVIQYLEHIEEGVMQPAAQPRVLRRTELTALVDGQRSFGQLTSNLALDIGLEIVRERGLAAVATTNGSHIGRLGDYPERAAREGYLGIAFANGMRSPGSVAPYGGRKGMLGTNPVAVAVPRPDGAPPIVVDFATSVLSEGKVRVSRNRGVWLKPDTILNSAGDPSTNPQDFYDGGCLLPLGGHKGYALSFACDLLAGLLTGSGTPSTPDYPGSNPIFLILLDPASFRPPEEFLADVEQLAKTITSSPVAAGSEEILMPGDPENRARSANAELVPVDESTWKLLGDKAASYQIELPSPG